MAAFVAKCGAPAFVVDLDFKFENSTKDAHKKILVARYKVKNEVDAETEVPEETTEEIMNTYTKIKEFWLEQAS